MSPSISTPDSYFTIWSSLPSFPDPCDIESILAKSQTAERFSFPHNKARIMIQAAGEGGISMYTMMAESLFSEPPNIRLVPQVMKAFRAAIEGKGQAEEEGCAITMGSYQVILDDLLERVYGWEEGMENEFGRCKEVVAHYALNTAAEFDDVEVAEAILSHPHPNPNHNLNLNHKHSTSPSSMITLSFLTAPFYTSTRHGSTSVLSLLLHSLFHCPQHHLHDRLRIARILGVLPTDPKVSIHLYIHALSILTESLSRTPVSERDTAVTVLLLPRYNHFMGNVESCDLLCPVEGFVERARRFWAEWPVDVVFRLVVGLGLRGGGDGWEGPGCLRNAIERCLEGFRQIRWDRSVGEWVLDLEA